MEQNNLLSYGGIYAILNIRDFKAYVGQAKHFINRTHNELKNGLDNPNLQSDYDNPDIDFVYMILWYDNWNVDHIFSKKEKEDLDKHEKFYMTLLEDFKFTLYNKQHNKQNSRTNRTLDKLNITESFYNEAKEDFINSFEQRFNISPYKLFKSPIKCRLQALDIYENKRKRKEFSDDIFLFGKQRLNHIFSNKIVTTLKNIDEIFISKAGNYLGEGIDQILHYEINSIKKHNYCLWTFSTQGVSYAPVRQYCLEREAAHKDTYVLFEFTTSTLYANAASKKFSQLSHEKEKSVELSANEIGFLSFDIGDDGHYYVPDDIDCTATSSSQTKAFVIEDFFLLDDVLNVEKIRNNYKAIQQKGVVDGIHSFSKRTTQFIKANNPLIQLSEITEKPSRRNFCFVGKLVAPYVLSLNSPN